MIVSYLRTTILSLHFMMPQLKERAIILEKIERRVELLRRRKMDLLSLTSSDESEDSSDSSSSSDHEMNALEVRRKILKKCRYLHRRESVPKSSHFVNEVLKKLNDARFKEDVRMSREAFADLTNRLSGHRVFHNTSRHPQRSVQLQFMVALYRFGCSGNGASVGKVARHFGLSEGAVILYTNRVIVALLSIEKDVILWPDVAERKVIKKRIFELSSFPNCLGFVDGTLIVLANKPNMEGADYFSHKARYGINTLIVCDDLKRIRYLFAGFCGSAHDNRVFANSKLARFPDQFFSGGEYILADSAYTNTTNVICSYKKPAALLEENEHFNYRHSQIRIKVEHCNGMLKGRFQSLKGLRGALNNSDDHRKIVYWIRA